jgi:TRAP-type C4-dicarboxylate transport system permease small subunit
MPRILVLLDRALFIAIAALLAVMVADVAWQVFTRYVLDDPAPWTEEIARYVFTWQIFLGAALAFGRGAHIVVDAVLVAFKGEARRVILCLGYVATIALLAPLVWYGIAMVRLTSNTYATASGLNIGFVYAALPVGAALGLAYVTAHLVTVLRGGEPATAAPTNLVD